VGEAENPGLSRYQEYGQQVGEFALRVGTSNIRNGIFKLMERFAGKDRAVARFTEAGEKVHQHICKKKYNGKNFARQLLN
jgi:hypothetical protein